MSEDPSTMNRRHALGVMVGATVAVPLGVLGIVGSAPAAELPQVSEEDPIAAGLKYRHNAARAKRADKDGVAADQQFCNRCQFSAGEGDWLPCKIFPGKVVNARGWCSAWAPPRAS